MVEENSIKKGARRMNSMEKLGKLLLHWQEHNEEHALSYKKWAEEAEASGFHKVAEILEKVHEETLKINSLFEEARKEVEKNKTVK